MRGTLNGVKIEGTFGGVIVSKLDFHTYTSEFESHWVPHSFSLVPHRRKSFLNYNVIGDGVPRVSVMLCKLDEQTFMSEF